MDPRFSEAEAMKFFDMLAAKGVMKTPTAKSRKFAIQKVLSVLDSNEKLDLRAIDREDAVRRFVNKYGQTFHPDSLETYAHRFNVGLNDFVSWVDNPMGFRPASSQRSPRTSRANEEAATSAAQSGPTPKPPGEVAKTLFAGSTTAGTTLLPDSIAIPIPLPSGGIAQLYLPKKVTVSDADRIAAVAKALAVGQGD
jgi:hypothetical protein